MNKIIPFFLLFLLLPQLLLAAYEPPTKDIYIFVDVEGGIRSELVKKARVPLFCLYKSGKLLWTESSGNDYILKEADLDKDQVAALLELYKDSDSWNTTYENCPFDEMPITKITLNNDSGTKVISVRGIDYEAKHGTIPASLIKFYRHMSTFTLESGKQYMSDQMFLYIKRAEYNKDSQLTYVKKWHSKVSLEALYGEARSSDIISAKIDGKNSKKLQKDLFGIAPYSTSLASIIFRQGRNYWSVAYRPLLPHEIKK